MSPQRIQRKRTKGWRMPEGAIYVGRPTMWGNPFTVANGFRQGFLVYDDRPESKSGGYLASFPTKREANAHAVKLFKRWMRTRRIDYIVLYELRGRDLTCWCKPEDPCHADVLLQIANRHVNGLSDVSA